MIFKQVEEIITGQKTQTRRVRKEDEYDTMDLYYDLSNAVAMQSPSKIDTVWTHEGGRIKWQVGRKYVVQPGRGMPQVFYRDNGDDIQLAHETIGIIQHPKQTWLEIAKQYDGRNWGNYLESQGWQPLSILITDIRLEPLENITLSDALAEGIKRRESGYKAFGKWQFWDYLENDWIGTHLIINNPTYSYRTLWESINGKSKGFTWDDSPKVWVLEFQAVTS